MTPNIERYDATAPTVTRTHPGLVLRAAARRRQAPASASVGTRHLSVVIPTLNEAGVIAQTLDCLRCGRVWEVIVVDAGSTDRTRAIARARGAVLVASAPGRGRQLRAGAAAATGDTLLFLHADTHVPRRFDEHIATALDRPGVCAGAFRLRIGADGRAYRLIEVLVNIRSRFRQMPYGDQGVFLPADVYRRAGGFPDWPMMEDYAFIRRLRRMGRVAIAPAAVVTSARRWRRNGVWRTTLINRLCIAAYRLGVSPQRIAGWR